MARENALSYSVSANGLAGDWYWEVTSDGNVIARGLSPTTVRARADALTAAASCVEPQSEHLSQSRGDAFPSLNFGAA
jgi:hypothetical protein